jgi:hypothetical protein
VPDKRDEVQWIPDATPPWWEQIGRTRWERMTGPFSANAAWTDREAVRALREQPPDACLGDVMEREAEDYRTGILWYYVDQGELRREERVSEAIARLNSHRQARWDARRSNRRP